MSRITEIFCPDCSKGLGRCSGWGNLHGDSWKLFLAFILQDYFYLCTSPEVHSGFLKVLENEIWLWNEKTLSVSGVSQPSEGGGGLSTAFTVLHPHHSPSTANSPLPRIILPLMPQNTTFQDWASKYLHMRSLTRHRIFDQCFSKAERDRVIREGEDFITLYCYLKECCGEVCTGLFSQVITQNHKIVWDGNDLRNHPVPISLPCTRALPTRSGCLKPHPAWP